MDPLVKKPMTLSERVKKCRNKNKMDETYKTSENKRVESIRKSRVKSMTNFQAKRYKASAAERQRKHRAKKKQLGIALPIEGPQENSNEVHPARKPPYRSPQALGRAINKSFRSLPYSPTKKLVVFSGLAKKFGLDVQKKMNLQMSNYRKSDCEDLVHDFYLRSDIVYTMPGLKDEMVVWVDGQKTRLRKYYLTMFLREAHAIFQSCYEKLSFSRFCELRPKNVLLLKNSPIDQCRCKLHENFRLKLKAVKETYEGDWWEKVLCQSGNLKSDCWIGSCMACCKGKLVQFDINITDNTTWQEWVKDPTGRIIKIVNEGCTGEVHEKILEDISTFQEHVRIKRIQANAFENDKLQGHRILQIDFAMAYSCDYQNEVQSALWSRESVQLFTAALFSEKKCSQTFLVCSDTKDKGKNSIYAFIMRLYKEILRGDDSGMKDIIYSDGPSSEFKNKFMVKLLWILSKKFKKDFHWKFFATSHGKGVVDGIGGKAKSLVRQKVMSKAENIVVQSSIDFAKLASELMPATTVFHVSQQEIDSTISNEKPFEDVISFSGIQKMHSIRCLYSTGEIQLWGTDTTVDNSDPDIHLQSIVSAPAAPNSTAPSTAVSISNLQVGDWCAVLYDGKVFAGEILSFTSSEVQVNVMIPTGKFWKWPEKEDVLFYPIESVVKKLQPPNVAGSRGQFNFEGLQH